MPVRGLIIWQHLKGMNKPVNLLFVAMSDSQETYYHALSDHEQICGHVLRVKQFAHGNFINGWRWAKKHQLDASKWLSFKLMKEASNRPFYGLTWLLKAGLYIDVLRFVDAFQKQLTTQNFDAIIVLNGAHYKQQAALAAAQAAGIKPLFIELGCLPNTTAIDSRGVNYNNSLPRQSKFYQRYQPSTEFTLPTSLLIRPPVKQAAINSTLPDQYLFVPFQVHDDTQILLQSPWIKSMDALYDVLESALPMLDSSIAIVIKEHPSDKHHFNHLHSRNSRLIFANGNNTADLIRHSCGVATINSTVGIEALMLGKPVITLGNAFYNIDKLVQHADNQSQFNQYIQALPNALYDTNLVTHFIAYLKEQYLVSGRPKEFDHTHIDNMTNAITNALDHEQ